MWLEIDCWDVPRMSQFARKENLNSCKRLPWCYGWGWWHSTSLASTFQMVYCLEVSQPQENPKIKTCSCLQTRVPLQFSCSFGILEQGPFSQNSGMKHPWHCFRWMIHRAGLKSLTLFSKRRFFVGWKCMGAVGCPVTWVEEGLWIWSVRNNGKELLGGGFKDFLFSPENWEDSPVDKYFSIGLKPPTRWSRLNCCFCWCVRAAGFHLGLIVILLSSKQDCLVLFSQYFLIHRYWFRIPYDRRWEWHYHAITMHHHLKMCVE